ncbi:hypothetical protein IGI04_023210 [Brassica rapa subsp. trilocularis]|uniref:Ubiquitin-like protease family profile domain-containing protein n=1 Tax=Brassica rapa subsp. trilocularis TaxID=1813537 RepID=A0ABQ7M373_BRACM|nr:hypothetical protein IGI04_023210 [Brassica rapa subsp. trilocularis]
MLCLLVVDFIGSEPATSSERCLSSKSLLPVSLTASTLASEQTVFHLSWERTQPLKEALEADEWEELKNLRVGVFLKFHKMKFGWASRLVHYILYFQLDCKKKFELWSLVTTDMKAFWAQMGVNFDRGPSIDEITTVCQMCRTWSRDDRLRLGQEKAPGEYAETDGELEDEKADSILKAMFSSGWAWEQSHWPLVGTKLRKNVKSDAESRKKARESPGLDVETMKGEIVRWLTGLTSNMVEGLSRCDNTLKTQSRMIEGLTTQVGAVEKMDSAEESKGDESDESKGEESKGEESKAAETAPKGMTTRAKARDTQATKLLALWPVLRVSGNVGLLQLSSLLLMETARQSKWRQKVKGSSSHWFYILLTPTNWLIDTHMDAGINLLRLRYTKHPEWFRSDRICMLDAVFTQMWTAKYSEFLASPANPDGSGKLLPPGALDYYTGEEPAYSRSNKTWALEIDDIYEPLLVKNDHWVACWISIPRRRIVIWDSDLAYATDAEIAKAVKPIANMLPYMRLMLSTGAERELYTVDFTHERESGVPQNKQSGDCGVYCLKYIECHALGMPFPPHELCDKKIKTIRSQMASEIFDETRVNGPKKRDYKHLGVYD